VSIIILCSCQKSSKTNVLDIIIIYGLMYTTTVNSTAVLQLYNYYAHNSRPDDPTKKPTRSMYCCHITRNRFLAFVIVLEYTYLPNCYYYSYTINNNINYINMLTEKRTVSDKPAERNRPACNYKEPAPDVPGPFRVRHDLGAGVAGDTVADPDGTVHGEEHSGRPTLDIEPRPISR